MKYLFTLFVTLLTFSLTSCDYIDFISKCSWKNISSSDSAFVRAIQLNKIEDYLYEVTFSDYDLDEGEELYNTIDIPFGGCTSVRNGDFLGRNLDWLYDETVDFVVHTPAIEGRHATLGVSGIIPFLNKFNANFGTYDENYKLIPYVMMDGINDAGLVVNANLQPLGDRGLTTGTNPGKDRMNTVLAVRYLLDYAGSVDEAIELLKKKDLHYAEISGSVMEVHLMLSDPKKTSVVEFVDNKMVVVEDSVVMTNYFLSQGITPHAQGVERADLVKENYKKGETKEGMIELMRMVNFSNYYNPKTSPRWYSDMFDGDTSDKPDLTWDSDKKTIEKYYLKEVLRFKLRNRVNYETWHTVHNSIYNIKEKTLDILVQEQETVHHFDINQK